VSQLIKALQQGQIDQKQALQQASGAETPPAGSPAPAKPASSPRTGGQGRVSPGLISPAPAVAAPTDSPFGTATQHVAPAPTPAGVAAAPVGLRGFVLRNQEAAAAALGALLVLLIGLAFLLFR
jgi:hypothetical protein